jgi:hypothetical protein
LIAQRVPMIAVAGRLGHANAVVTMMVYAPSTSWSTEG